MKIIEKNMLKFKWLIVDKLLECIALISVRVSDVAYGEKGSGDGQK